MKQKTKNIVYSILEGIKKADKIYRKLTGGYFISAGPESFLVAKISEQIKETVGEDNYIFLEYGINQIRDNESKSIIGRMPKEVSEGSSFDIALLDNNYQMQYVVEVKNLFYFSDSINIDCRRLEWILNQFSALKENCCFEAGIVAVFIAAKRQSEEKCKEYLRNSIETYSPEFRSNTVNCKVVWDGLFTKPYVYDEEIDGESGIAVGTCFCLVIQKSK